jgi:Rrf2 family nitric oxide-sensitive transcriptional repressor
VQLTRYTDYSLRLLMFLALQEDERLVTITETAEHFAIPRNHLVKIVHRLGQLNYLRTVRGKRGGIRLARPPGDIRIGEVVRTVEPTLDVVDCRDPICPLLPACKLKGLLNAARDAFLTVLDGCTLQDLVDQPHRMRLVLHWPASETPGP